MTFLENSKPHWRNALLIYRTSKMKRDFNLLIISNFSSIPKKILYCNFKQKSEQKFNNVLSLSLSLLL